MQYIKPRTKTKYKTVSKYPVIVVGRKTEVLHGIVAFIMLTAMMFFILAAYFMVTE
jgi:hypothetical protein